MADNEGPVTASGGGGGEPITASEEPQEERGAPGSRDEGLPPGEKPSDRPAGTSDGDDHTSVDPQDSKTGPTMPAGDQGG
jgi:hypothetical protein